MKENYGCMPPLEEFDSIEAYNDYYMNVYQQNVADDSTLEDEYLDFEKPLDVKKSDLGLEGF